MYICTVMARCIIQYVSEKRLLECCKTTRFVDQQNKK